jgi:hypothetical protein
MEILIEGESQNHDGLERLIAFFLEILSYWKLKSKRIFGKLIDVQLELDVDSGRRGNKQFQRWSCLEGGSDIPLTM